MKHAPRTLVVAATLLLAVVAEAAAGCGGGGDTGVEVHALWYGTTQSGTAVGGVTPVRISAVGDDPNTPLAVDTRGLAESGAGPQWTAATSLAGVQAVLMSGADPRLQQLRYSLHDQIDGSSAGGLLATGSLAALRGSHMSGSTTMTGTVQPDGSIGHVTGIAEKIRAAAAAGYDTVLIPPHESTGYDSKTGGQVDLARLGRSLGVDVKPVNSVHDAYVATTGQDTAPPATGPPPPISPRLLRMLARRSRALIASARQHASARVSELVDAAERALARHDPVLAFTAAAEADLAGRQEAVSGSLAAGGATLAQQTARLERTIARSERSIRAQLVTTAQLPVTHIAQLTALADTLSWGDFALTSMRVASDRLQDVRSQGELDEIARFVDVGRFEAEVYMPACAESVHLIGREPITDVGKTVGLLNAYTDLIGYAAEANRTYADSLGLGTRENTYLGQLIHESDDLRAATSTEFRDLGGPTALPVLRLSVALLEYVETTQVVNDLTSRYGPDKALPPNLQPIDDPATVRTQALVAAGIARRRVRVITAAGLDPSFVQWNSQWGADLAFRRLPNTSDEQTLHGLQFQWFAVLQSRLLTAMAGLGEA